MIKKSKINFIGILFVFYFALDSIATFFNSILTSIIGVNSIDTAFVYGLYLLILMLTMIMNFRKIKFIQISIFIVITIMILLDIAIFPENTLFLLNITFTIYLSALGFLTILFINNVSDFDKYMKYVAFISFLLLFSQPFWPSNVIFVSEGDLITSGFMNFSYKLLPSCIIFFYLYLKERKNVYLFCFIIILVELIIFGSRGPVISVMIYGILYFVFIDKKNTKKLLYVFMIPFIVLFVLFITYYINDIYNWLYSLGIRSDLLYRIIDQTIFDSQRDWIYSTLLQEVFELNIFGGGLMADRRILFEVYGELSYAHNFFLEILLQYGIVFGTIFSALLIINISRILFMKNYQEWKHMFILIFSIIFPKLMVSSSYLINPYFYTLIGLIWIINHKIIFKRRKNYA